MKRIALEIVALGSGIDEAVVEVSIVSHQYCTCAMLCFHFLANILENFPKHFRFLVSDSQGMVRINPGELQRRLFKVGTRKRFYSIEPGILRFQDTIFIHADTDGSNFQYGISLVVKPATLNIHHHGQVAAKTAGKQGGWLGITGR